MRLLLVITMNRRQTFYQFVLKYTDPYKLDKKTQFANLVSKDVAFPKYNQTHEQIRDYVELTDMYSSYTLTFDELWSIYEQE